MAALSYFDWNDAAIARLTALWNDGLSTAEIGRKMRISKNAVVGKAKRLHLQGRPSPILRNADGAPRPPRPISGKQTLRAVGVVLDSVKPPARETTPRKAPKRDAGTALMATLAVLCAPPAPPPPAIVPAPAPIRLERSCRCQWPTWMEKNAAYYAAIRTGEAPSCGKPALRQTVLGADYCAEHAAKATVRRSPGYVSTDELARMANGSLPQGQSITVERLVA